jgi:hypothetical protein
MKIGAVVGLLVVALSGTNALAVSRMNEMGDDQQRIYEENLLPLNALSAVQRATAAHRARVLEYAVSDPARRVELLGETRSRLMWTRRSPSTSPSSSTRPRSTSTWAAATIS